MSEPRRIIRNGEKIYAGDLIELREVELDDGTVELQARRVQQPVTPFGVVLRVDDDGTIVLVSGAAHADSESD